MTGRKRPEAEDVSSNRQLAQGSGGGFGLILTVSQGEVVPTRQGQERTPKAKALPAVTNQCHSTHQAGGPEKKKKIDLVWRFLEI